MDKTQMKSHFDNEAYMLRKGIDELFATVRDYASSDKFKELLRFTAHFKKYAPYNAMLIHIQNPGARYVLPARSWQKYNRTVINDRCPIIILWPFSPVYCVYDVGDTMVMPGRNDLFPKDLAKPYDGDPDKQVDESRFRKLVDSLKYWGIVYEEMKTAECYSGKLEIGRDNDPDIVFAKEDQCPREWRPAYSIRVCAGTNITVKFATIVHELGHLFCGHLRNSYVEHPPETAPRNLSVEAKEFEAETVSWLVCRRLGIDNPAYKYLANYFHNNKSIPEEVSVDEILKATRLAEQVLGGWPLEGCYLYTKSAQFKKATDEFRARLKSDRGKNEEDGSLQ